MKSRRLLTTLLLALPLLAQDPALRGVRLTYEMPVEAMQRSLRNRPEINVEQLLAETVESVRARMPENVKVARGDATTFTVDLPAMTRAELALMRASIETIPTNFRFLILDF